MTNQKSTQRIPTADTLWRNVRADTLDSLAYAYPLLPFEERVQVAEHAAREVQDLAATLWNDHQRRTGHA